jgi:hypothetical protein
MARVSLGSANLARQSCQNFPEFRHFLCALPNRYRDWFAFPPDVKANIQQASCPLTLLLDTKPAMTPDQNEEVLDSEEDP